MEDGFASAIINLVPKLEPRDEDNDITGEFVESILPTVEPTSNENKSDPLATKIKVENPYLLKEFKVLLRDCLKNVTTLKSDVKDEPEDNVEEYTENVDHFSDSQGTEYPSDNESSMPQENVTNNWQRNFKTESVPSSSKQKTSTAWIYKLNKAEIQEQLRNFGLPEVNYLQDGRRILKAFLSREYDPAGKTRTSTETLTNNPPRTENESTMTSQSNVIPEQENNVSANKRKRKKLSYHQGDSSVSESDNDESYNPQEALQEFLPTKKTRTSTVREKTLNKGKLLSAKTKTVKEMLSSLPSETGIAVEPAQIGSLLPKKPSKKKKRTNETELSCFLSSETGIAVETAQIDPSLAEKPSAEKKTNGTQMDVVLWYCPSCELQFKQFIEFYRHHIDKHSAEELKCLKCPDQLFASPDQIEKHNLDAHLVSSKKSYHCEECRLVFGLKSSYFLHRAMCTESKRVCSGILDSLIDFAVMRNEVQVDEGTDFRLSCCEKIINTLEEFFQHKSNEHNVARSTCGLCLSVAQTDSQMRSHYRKVHLKKYWNRLTLGAEDATSDEEDETNKADEDVTTKVKEIICTAEQDSKTFDKAACFSCDICGRAFGQKKELHFHTLTNHSLNLFTMTCIICNSVYTSKKSLVKHINSVHYRRTNGIRFSCKFCDKTFSLSKNLARHIKAFHEKKGEFTCSSCDRSFNDRDYLVSHIKLKHPPTQHNCIACNQVVSSKKSLFSHLAKKHSPSELCEVFKTEEELDSHMFGHSYGESKDENDTTQANRDKCTTQHDGKTLDRRFLCDICGSEFTQMSGLNFHNLTKHSLNPFKISCMVCKITFANKQSMQKHIRKAHFQINLAAHKSADQFECKMCDKTFTLNRNLLRHIRVFHEEKQKLQCTVCRRKYRDKSGLIKHIQSRHPPTKHNYTICDQVFSSKTSLCSHKIMEHTPSDLSSVFKTKEELEKITVIGHSDEENMVENICNNGETRAKVIECSALQDGILCECADCFKVINSVLSTNDSGGPKPFQCKPCNQRFYSRSNLNEHVRHHTGYKLFPCDICVKAFTRRSALQAHKLYKHSSGANQLSCSICNRMFASKNVLKRHIAEVHMQIGRHVRFQCEQCKRIFSSRCSFMRHIRALHDKNEKFVCDYCKKTYYDKRTLIQHIHSKHMLNERHTCQKCNMTFTTNLALSRHNIKSHSDRRFCCEICGKMFKLKVTLENHMIVHFNEKSFICQTCGKTFKREVNLIQHQHTHSDSRPHVCNLCGKTFKLRTHIKQHMAVHGVNKMIKCDICQKAFARKSQLNSHMLTHGM